MNKFKCSTILNGYSVGNQQVAHNTKWWIGDDFWYKNKFKTKIKQKFKLMINFGNSYNLRLIKLFSFLIKYTLLLRSILSPKGIFLYKVLIEFFNKA